MAFSSPRHEQQHFLGALLTGESPWQIISMVSSGSLSIAGVSSAAHAPLRVDFLLVALKHLSVSAEISARETEHVY